jgi:ectoine hydrolase
MSLRGTDHTILEENMTFHFMPAIWFDDWGFEMTESIRVGSNGGECLSNVPRKLLVK